MNRNKKQGTAFETWTRKALEALGIQSRRLPEGGSRDEGDVEALLGRRWVIECKAQSSLNIQKVLGQARRKAGGEPVMLVWKRLVSAPGKKIRQPVEGERVVVVLGWDDFVQLVTDAHPNSVTSIPSMEDES
jgi:hypothetical protein